MNQPGLKKIFFTRKFIGFAPYYFFHGVFDKNFIIESVRIRKRHDEKIVDEKDKIIVSILLRFNDGTECLHDIGAANILDITRRGIEMLPQEFNCEQLKTCEDFILTFYAANRRAASHRQYEMFIRIKRLTIKIFDSVNCVVCFENNSSVLLCPCLHQCVCKLCFKKMQPIYCPICRSRYLYALDYNSADYIYNENYRFIT